MKLFLHNRKWYSIQTTHMHREAMREENPRRAASPTILHYFHIHFPLLLSFNPPDYKQTIIFLCATESSKSWIWPNKWTWDGINSMGVDVSISNNLTVWDTANKRIPRYQSFHLTFWVRWLPTCQCITLNCWRFENGMSSYFQINREELF